jgi:hypothetical protein
VVRGDVRGAGGSAGLATGDLAVQPDWLRIHAHPDITALADALLTPLLGGDHTLEEACDLRALEREAAALRLEREQAGQPRRRPSRNCAAS